MLADLRARLRSTRWPDQVQDAGREQGTERETLRSLDPEAHGIAGPAFDVVIGSLPGYGFSDRSPSAGATPRATAERFVELMRGLGYDRFVAHGSDFGAEVLTQLALCFPQHLAALHLSTFDWRLYLGEGSRPLSPAEREYVAARDGWVEGEYAYDELQSTKPQSLGYALNDSPAGMAGWMLEKWRAWSDCRGDVIGHFGRDFLLATLTIDWVTETATSSARLYYDHRRYQPSLGPRDHVEASTAVALFRHNFVTEGVPPREWAERLFNVCRWTDMPRGGHFAATEEPVLLATDIAAFFAGDRWRVSHRAALSGHADYENRNRGWNRNRRRRDRA